jgi:hypothetical protein
MNITNKLSILAEDFENWRKNSHTQEQYAVGYTDDAGYPNWQQVEDTLEIIFKGRLLKKLAEEDKARIIYLIARNWDVGTILNWQHIKDKAPISYLGLTEQQFLLLCPFALRSKEEDAKAQFVRLIPYLTEPPKAVLIDWLLKFYAQGEAYSKRLSLYALLKLQYPPLQALTKQSWAIEVEEHKIACLSILETLESEDLEAYLQEAERRKDWPYLQNAVASIRARQTQKCPKK